MRYYLVGGAVRDLLLGTIPHELDIVFDGSLEAFLSNIPQAVRASAAHPIYIVNGHEYVPLQGSSIDADLMQRDFTINAMAVSETGLLHLHPDALQDLRASVLRPVSESAFKNDPLRVFRAARFMARNLHFTLHASALPLIRETAQSGSLASVAAERVGSELAKAMAGEKPGNFLKMLNQADALSPWFAELDGAASIPAGPAQYHGSASVLDHISAVMDRVAASYAARNQAGAKEAALAAWMALCHDLGKATTPADTLPRHPLHEKRGAEMAVRLAQRLRLSRQWEKAGAIAARLHMQGGRYRNLRRGTRVDLLSTLHAAHVFEPFLALVAADAGDRDLSALMRQDMASVLAVHLSPSMQKLGAVSGEKLRELRCQALGSLA